MKILAKGICAEYGVGFVRFTDARSEMDVALVSMISTAPTLGRPDPRRSFPSAAKVSLLSCEVGPWSRENADRKPSIGGA